MLVTFSPRASAVGVGDDQLVVAQFTRVIDGDGHGIALNNENGFGEASDNIVYIGADGDVRTSGSGDGIYVGNPGWGNDDNEITKPNQLRCVPLPGKQKDSHLNHNTIQNRAIKIYGSAQE